MCVEIWEKPPKFIWSVNYGLRFCCLWSFSMWRWLSYCSLFDMFIIFGIVSKVCRGCEHISVFFFLAWYGVLLCVSICQYFSLVSSLSWNGILFLLPFPWTLVYINLSRSLHFHSTYMVFNLIGIIYSALKFCY